MSKEVAYVQAYKTIEAQNLPKQWMLQCVTRRLCRKEVSMGC